MKAKALTITTKISYTGHNSVDQDGIVSEYPAQIIGPVKQNFLV